MLTRQILRAGIAGLALIVVSGALATPTSFALQQQPQQPAPAGGRGGPPPDQTKPQKLDVTTGTKARYKVTEQLLGVSFPNDAVGTTEAITGTIIVNPDGTFGADSKLTVDLKTLSSDQSMRDGYIQTRTLETAKFPTLVIVPKKAIGLPAPLPVGQGAQGGFQLVTDMTLHGVTKEVTFNVVATFANTSVAGRATTTVQFADFGMTKPTLARLVSVDEKIQLEIEFRCTRAAM